MKLKNAAPPPKSETRYANAMGPALKLPSKLSTQVPSRASGERTLELPSNAVSCATLQVPTWCRPSGTVLPAGHGPAMTTAAVDGYARSMGPAPDAPKSSTVKSLLADCE